MSVKSRISLSDTPVSYETLQDGKLVTFNPVPDAKPDSPEWMRVTLEDGVPIIGMKEVSSVIFYALCSALMILYSTGTEWRIVSDRWHRRSKLIVLFIVARHTLYHTIRP